MRSSLLYGAFRSPAPEKFICLRCRRLYTTASEKKPPVATASERERLGSHDDAVRILKNAFQFHRYPGSRFRRGRRPIHLPHRNDQSPLIQDLLRRMDYWRTHPHRQIKEEMLKAWNRGSLIHPQNNTPIPPLTGPKSSEEVADILGDIYSEHLETFHKMQPPRPSPSPDTTSAVEENHFPPEAGSPRGAKAFPPLRAPEVINYINDIYSALLTLPISSTDPDIESNYPHAHLPGTCPYPILFDRGYIQPRPGALLLSPSRPQQITHFTSTEDFEAYIYSLCFHRDISERTTKMILSAILNPHNTQYLSDNIFHYAIHALIVRKNDLYNARRLAGYMTSFPHLGLSIKIWNLFLLGSLKIESLRSFALILRELLIRDIPTTTRTWNLVLQMGIKLKSHNWVSSTLQVMKSRGVGMDQDSLKWAFRVLRDVLAPERMREEYLKHFAAEEGVPWKVFNVVLQCYCQHSSIDEGWQFLLITLQHVNDLRNLEGHDSPSNDGKEEIPPEATLHLLIRQCLLRDEYTRAWSLIGEFRSRWGIHPHSSGIWALIEYAYEKEEFSDMILLWEYALAMRWKWKMLKRMVWRGRDLEREYGISLPRKFQKDVLTRWVERTSEDGKGKEDPLARVPKGLREHVRMMKARKTSLKLSSSSDPSSAGIPEDVTLWRQIEATYSKAVSAGLWKPRPEPLTLPLPKIYPSMSGNRNYRRVRNLVKIEPPWRRVEGGLNFLVREKVKVWKMVNRGELKLVPKEMVESQELEVKGMKVKE